MKRGLLCLLACSLLVTTSAFAQTVTQGRITPPSGSAEAAMPLNGTWTILDEFMTIPGFFTGSWDWNSPSSVVVSITDVYVVTDQFEIYDNGNYVLTTPYRPDWDVLGYPSAFTTPPWESNPDLALASGFFCSAVIEFPPGAHSLTIKDIHAPLNDSGVPFGDGTVAFKAELKVCQPSLGYAGPGDTVMSMCGGDLSTGTTADLWFHGGTPNAAAIVVLGALPNPIAFHGGLLVPSPPYVVGPFPLDAAGEYYFAGIPGGGGPVILYAQTVSANPAMPYGAEISNCLEITRLP